MICRFVPNAAVDSSDAFASEACWGPRVELHWPIRNLSGPNAVDGFRYRIVGAVRFRRIADVNEPRCVLSLADKDSKLIGPRQSYQISDAVVVRRRTVL
jgi:hypothetical protein